MRNGLRARGADDGAVSGAMQMLFFAVGLSVVADFVLIRATNRLAKYYNAGL